MNKDRVEGKLKDVGGRIERQVGEWTGDSKKQAQGAAMQIEGKVQNAMGKVKDAVTRDSDGRKASTKPPQRSEDPLTPMRIWKSGTPGASVVRHN
jgi:uncharacterized protein YjbJ (UPF0337 family)